MTLEMPIDIPKVRMLLGRGRDAYWDAHWDAFRDPFSKGVG